MCAGLVFVKGTFLIPFPPLFPLPFPQTIVKGTPFDTVSKDELAVENKAMAGKSVFERAMADFNGRYPAVAALGLGPSAKAERWNGRHAMFGWIALLATGYAQAHGLLPEGGMDAKEWGTVSFLCWGGGGGGGGGGGCVCVGFVVVVWWGEIYDKRAFPQTCHSLFGQGAHAQTHKMND